MSCCTTHRRKLATAIESRKDMLTEQFNSVYESLVEWKNAIQDCCDGINEDIDSIEAAIETAKINFALCCSEIASNLDDIICALYEWNNNLPIWVGTTSTTSTYTTTTTTFTTHTTTATSTVTYTTENPCDELFLIILEPTPITTTSTTSTTYTTSTTTTLCYPEGNPNALIYGESVDYGVFYPTLIGAQAACIGYYCEASNLINGFRVYVDPDWIVGADVYAQSCNSIPDGYYIRITADSKKIIHIVSQVITGIYDCGCETTTTTEELICQFNYTIDSITIT